MRWDAIVFYIVLFYKLIFLDLYLQSDGVGWGGSRLLDPTPSSPVYNRSRLRILEYEWK